MQEFLNRYMKSNRHMEHHGVEVVSPSFTDTIKLLYDAVGKQVFKPKGPLNAAVFDAVMVGLSDRLETNNTSPEKDTVRTAYEQLLNSPDSLRSASLDEPRHNVRALCHALPCLSPA